MSRFQRLIVLILLFAFSACSQNSVILSETSAPPPAKTVMPNIVETDAALTPLPTLSFANTPLPTFTLAATPVFQQTLGRTPQVPSGLTFDQINPIFYGKSLLGATFGGNWLYPPEVYSLLGNPQVYDFYDQNFQPFQATAVVPEPPPGGRISVIGWA